MYNLLRSLLVFVLLFCGETVIGQTFTFTLSETTIHYSDVNQTYYYHGSVSNLLSGTRTLVYTLTPVSYPDSSRQSAICTFLGCYPPRSGAFTIDQEYEASQVDDSVKFYIYNARCDWTPGWCSPVEAPLDGDQSCDVSVHSLDNPSEIISYRLNLIFSNGDVRVIPTLHSGDVALVSNYPNPFNGETTIQFELSNNGFVELNVYDVLGRHVASLLSHTHFSAGAYETNWNARDESGSALPTGSYLVELRSTDQSIVRPIFLIR